MRNLLSLALFLLLSSTVCAQVNIDFSDIKKANSKEKFLKVCLSNGFELISDEDYTLTLAYEYDDNTEKAQVWAYYSSSTESFRFTIYDVGYYDDNPESGLYQQLTKEIKNCNYVKAFKHGFDYDSDALTYLLYSCPSSTYKGKIGYCLTTENGTKVGRIRTFTSGEIEFYEYTPNEE